MPSLTVTQRLPSDGGSIVVFTDRLGGRDLRGVIVHELGVALGGPNQQKFYSPSVQNCIDETQVKAMNIPGAASSARLDWCQVNVASARR